MSASPVILERACRDRAVTSHPMQAFRPARSGITGILVAAPTIPPTNNNSKEIPFEMLKDAFQNMSRSQPRNNRRAMYMSSRYMTAPFAEELGAMMGCAAERGKLPSSEFLEEALRPPPIYFETDEPTFQGICCVCYKKGCLGRCPNPSCGLLMHHTCVEPSEQGGDQQCPICKTEIKLETEVEESGTEFP